MDPIYLFFWIHPQEGNSGPAFFCPRQAVVKDIFEGLRLKQEPGLVTWGIEYPLRIFFVDHLVNLGGLSWERSLKMGSQNEDYIFL